MALPTGAFAQVAPRAEESMCSQLRRNPAVAIQLAGLDSAPTSIQSAQVVPAGGDGSIVEKDLPEICRIEGKVAPNVGFLLRMPTKTWNGKFMMGGCGGGCGNYLTDRIDPALVRNYAVVVTDMGHKGGGWTWAYNNIPGMIDFGYRSTHVTAIAAKEIIKAYYGQPASRNYFWGCSTGGRQALVEAQRFPNDFEGIIGGAPPMTQSEYHPQIVNWVTKVNTGPDGKAILTADKLPVVNAAVMAACDKKDNLADGIIQDPLSCAWKPSAIICKAGADPAKCLTPQQADVVQKIYDGPLWNPKGNRVYRGQGGFQPGSELTWRLNLQDGKGDSQQKYYDVLAARGPAFNDLDYDIERDSARTAMVEGFFSPNNVDMRNFEAAGGKFIFFIGMNDAVPARPVVEYYETATRVIGSEARTKDFFRLFLPSAMDHCRYGAGGGEVDWITYLENWVEKGQAPDSVLAYHMVKEPYPSMKRPINDTAESLVRMARHPLPAGSWDRAHPVYAYPDTPMWSGKGDPNDPATWKKGPKTKLLSSH